MDYTIEYRADEPTYVKFKPTFVDSNGTYNARLGAIAMKEFPPEGWEWKDGELYHFLRSSYPLAPSEIPPVLSLVEEAQQEVTRMMDILVDWGNLEKIFKEYRGA